MLINCARIGAVETARRCGGMEDLAPSSQERIRIHARRHQSNHSEEIGGRIQARRKGVALSDTTTQEITIVFVKSNIYLYRKKGITFFKNDTLMV